MKRIINFSKCFLATAIFSILLVLAGLTGYLLKGGFNLGVDFKAGLIQEVRFAPTAFSLTYTGGGNAVVSFTRNRMDIVISGPSIDNIDHAFAYTDYPSLKSLTDALSEKVSGLSVDLKGVGEIQSVYLLQNAQGNPVLGAEPFIVHYLDPSAQPVDISSVRDSLEVLGKVSVQVLGEMQDRHFMIRMDEKENTSDVSAEQIFSTLEKSFGAGEVLITRSDYVGSRFSKELSNQAGILMGLTLLLILFYASIRFKPQYAIGAVLAILHDALIMVGFIAWTRMEFNTTTIAAILTILGYSINDTIVIFDRIRETRRIYPDDKFVNVLDRAVSETLGRTVITTLTTMLAVVSLYVFTSGSMKDFALALLVGMLSGVYSTIFIASGFVNFWEYKIKPKQKNKKAAALEVSTL
ncbi:MAG: protein translocase subunit SecF [Termitinemataceae bacterium]|nr:MAG: protein translocase subunit SecF [Termitinemataceae bacterium]